MCGKEAFYVTKQKGYQAPNEFFIFNCKSCNTSFSLPRDKTDLYPLIYSQKEKIRSYNRYWKYYKEIRNKKSPVKYLSASESSYWGPIFALTQVLNPTKTSRMLDIGSGLGYFTYAIRSLGFNIEGIDISNEAIESAIEEFGNFYQCADLYRFANENKEVYDVIFMIELIEHLDDPHTFLKAAKNLLKPGGSIILTTPNKSFYPSNVNWQTDAPPVHSWWFSEKSINYLSDILNLECKLISFKNYHKKNPEIFRIKDIINEGNFVFDKNNVLIDNQLIINKSNKILSDIKKYFLYKFIKTKYYAIFHSEIFKSGDVQTNILCAILTK